MKKLNVLVACGAGIATSTVVMSKLEKLFEENNIDVELHQIKIAEAASKQKDADMLISTTILPTEYDIPAIKAMGFLTGIGVDKLQDEIIETAKKLGIHFLVWMKIPCQIFYTKKRTFAVPSLYNQFTTKIMKEG